MGNVTTSEMTPEREYTAAEIKVLTGLEAVRKRPGMYIGDTQNGSGLHNMVFSVVEEAKAGSSSTVRITLNADGSVTVEDNGPGMPTDVYPTVGVSAPDVIMTALAGRCNLAVANALSSRLDLTIWRDGKERAMAFAGGERIEPLRVVGEVPDRTGKRLTFTPSREIFPSTEFNYKVLYHGLRDLAGANPGARFIIEDFRCDPPRQAELHEPAEGQGA